MKINDMKTSLILFCMLASAPSMSMALGTGLTYSCNAVGNPDGVLAGEPITVKGVLSDQDPHETTNFSWSSKGAGIVLYSTASDVEIETQNASPGEYEIIGVASQQGKLFSRTASCSVKVKVNPSL